MFIKSHFEFPAWWKHKTTTLKYSVVHNMNYAFVTQLQCVRECIFLKHFCLYHLRETASNHESMATVLFNNFLIQLERQCSQEQNFLHRHNLKRIFHQIQVTDAHCPPVISTHLMHPWVSNPRCKTPNKYYWSTLYKKILFQSLRFKFPRAIQCVTETC